MSSGSNGSDEGWRPAMVPSRSIRGSESAASPGSNRHRRANRRTVSSASTAEMRSRGRRPARSGGRSVRCVATRSTVIRPRTEDFSSPAGVGDERRTRWTTRRRRARVPATWSRRCRPSSQGTGGRGGSRTTGRRHGGDGAALGPARPLRPRSRDERDHGEAGGVRLAAQRRHDGRRGEWPERGDTPAHCQLDVVAHRSVQRPAGFEGGLLTLVLRGVRFLTSSSRPRQNCDVPSGTSTSRRVWGGVAGTALVVVVTAVLLPFRDDVIGDAGAGTGRSLRAGCPGRWPRRRTRCRCVRRRGVQFRVPRAVRHVQGGLCRRGHRARRVRTRRLDRRYLGRPRGRTAAPPFSARQRSRRCGGRTRRCRPSRRAWPPRSRRWKPSTCSAARCCGQSRTTCERRWPPSGRSSPICATKSCTTPQHDKNCSSWSPTKPSGSTASSRISSR